MPCNTTQGNAVPCNTMQYDQIQYDNMQCDTIQLNTMQYQTNLNWAKRGVFWPFAFVFDRFLKLDGSIWAVTALDEH